MNLPTVKSRQRDGDHALLEIVAGPDLLYFQGHFTGDPILPGVVQIGWAVEFAANLFEITASASALKKIKFTRMIKPSVPLSLQLDFNRAKGRLKYHYFDAQDSFSSGEIVVSST